MTQRSFKFKIASHMLQLAIMFGSVAANRMTVTVTKLFFWQNSPRDRAYFFCSVEEFAQDQQQHEENENQTACVSKVQDAHNC